MVKKYGLNLLMSCDESVQAYLRKILDQLESKEEEFDMII